MLRLILSRVGMLVLLIWIVSLAVFGLTLLIPGDPTLTLLGDNATPDQIASLRVALGLNDPFFVRYGHWFWGVLHGDLGTSLFNSYSVADAIGSRIWVTVSLVVGALIISLVAGTIIGVIAGSRPGSIADRVLLFLSSVGIALPNFWLGILLVTLFGVTFKLFPTGGYIPFSQDPAQWFAHMTLPIITLALGGAAEVARQARASIIDTLQLDFIRTLHAKGVKPRTILLKHALRSALIPVVTVAGLQVSRLFGLSVLIEAVFSLPGIGTLLIKAVFDRDIPMVQGTVLLATVVVVVVNLLVDLAYGWLNPKAAV
ncbi:MAG: ABC transporter permease [Antricoccus sp.]